MDTLTGIKVFLQVVESGSFVAAADRLDVSTAMVSKHVMNAEQRLGVRLLNRNSRTLSLTEPGRIYFERCKVILDDLEEAELELGSLGSTPRGTLRVTCPSWFASQRLARLLVEYRARFPDIVVDVSFEDRFIDLVEDGYDLALRVTSRLESLPAGLIARPVRSLPFLVVASREYIKRNRSPWSLRKTSPSTTASPWQTWSPGSSLAPRAGRKSRRVSCSDSAPWRACRTRSQPAAASRPCRRPYSRSRHSKTSWCRC